MNYSPYAWKILRNAERGSLTVQMISVFLSNLFQSKYFQSNERRWAIESIIGTLNIGYGCCLILYIFYFRGTFHYLASKMLPATCTGRVKKPKKKAGIQSTVNLSASSARPVTVRPHNVKVDKSKTTSGLQLSVNPMHAKMKQFKRSHPPVSRLSTL